MCSMGCEGMGKVSEELVKKSWTVCGYKEVSDLENNEGSNNIQTTLDTHSDDNIAQIIENVGGELAMCFVNDPENEVGSANDNDNGRDIHEDYSWEMVQSIN